MQNNVRNSGTVDLINNTIANNIAKVVLVHRHNIGSTANIMNCIFYEILMS